MPPKEKAPPKSPPKEEPERPFGVAAPKINDFPEGPIDLAPLSDQLRSPDQDVVRTALSQILKFMFEEERLCEAFEKHDCLSPIIRLLQRPVTPIITLEQKPHEVFASTLLAIRCLAHIVSYPNKVRALIVRDSENVVVMAQLLSHTFWPVAESAMRALCSLSFYGSACELLCSTTNINLLKPVFNSLHLLHPSVPMQCCQLLQSLSRTYITRYYLCQCGLPELLGVIKAEETQPEVKEKLIQVMVVMTADVVEAKMEVCDAGMPECLIRLMVHPSESLKLAAVRALAGMANSCALFAQEIDKCGGVPVLHALIPKPSRQLIIKEKEEAAVREPTPVVEEEEVQEDPEWDDVAESGDINDTLMHDTFAFQGYRLPTFVKKKRKTPPPPKVQKTTPLQVPTESTQCGAMVEPLLQTVKGLIQQPSLIDVMLNKMDEGYEPSWLLILTYNLEYQPEPDPPLEPEPEPEPEPEEKKGKKGPSREKTPPGKKGGKDSPAKTPPKTPPGGKTPKKQEEPPPQEEPEAPKEPDVPDGMLGADTRFPSMEVYTAAFQALQLMLVDLDTQKAILADKSENFTTTYDFLENLKMLLRTNDYRLLEQGLQVVTRLVQVGGDYAVAKLVKADFISVLRELSTKKLVPANVKSSLAQALLGFRLRDILPPHRPPSPSRPSPPPSPRLPSWRDEPLRQRVNEQYIIRNPPKEEEPEDDEPDSDEEDNKKGRKGKAGGKKGKK